MNRYDERCDEHGQETIEYPANSGIYICPICKLERAVDDLNESQERIEVLIFKLDHITAICNSYDIDKITDFIDNFGTGAILGIFEQIKHASKTGDD